MATTTVNEPKVSVHGIPKSQYDSGAGDPTTPSPPPGQGGGLMQHFRDHWQIYTIGIGFATVGIMLLIYWSSKQNQSVNNSLAAPGDSSTYGSLASGSSPDQLWGAQLDADYQQLMYNQNTQVGILNQILNAITNPGSNPPGGTTNPPPPPTYKPQSVFPNPKGTSGESNNFWVYTTKAGDTLASLNTKAGWGTGAKANVATYRNNQGILSAMGFEESGTSFMTTPLPVGTKLSL